MRPEVTRCPTCHRKRTRSNPANARYWLLLHLISEKVKPSKDKGYSAEIWHEWAKSRFLGMDDVELPNGKTLHKVRSTAGLDGAEFADYVMKLEAWAAERGVYLEDLT